MNWHDRLDRLRSYIETQRTPQAVVGAYRRAIRLDAVQTDGDYSALFAARQQGLERLRADRANARAAIAKAEGGAA